MSEYDFMKAIDKTTLIVLKVSQEKTLKSFEETINHYCTLI